MKFFFALFLFPSLLVIDFRAFFDLFFFDSLSQAERCVFPVLSFLQADQVPFFIFRPDFMFVGFAIIF